MKLWFNTPEVTSLFYLIAMRLAYDRNGEGGNKSSDSCRMGEVESVGTVEVVCVGRLLRMGCDPFLMSVRGFVGSRETLWKQNGLPWEHSVETNRREEKQRQKA